MSAVVLAVGPMLCAALLQSPLRPAAVQPARRSAEPRMLPAREARLHKTARRAFFQGAHDEAMTCYELATLLPGMGSARSHLSKALLLSRQGHQEAARDAFAQGVMAHRKDAQLVQAWGLFESKYGDLRRSRMLLRRAVQLDGTLESVLRWQRFQPAAAATGGAARTSTVTMTSQQMDGAVWSAAETPSPSSSPRQLVQRPAVVYTVSQSKRGWRGREELGEDPSRWYDAEGPRNGPPQNYWRQAMDERLHRTAMRAIDELIEGDGGGAMAEETLCGLEERMGIRRPLANRKLLGRWAYVVSEGRPVAAPAAAAAQLRAPAILEVRRDGERKTVEHRYGTFDAHMEDGEPLVLTLSGGSGADGDAPAATFKLVAGCEGAQSAARQSSPESVELATMLHELDAAEYAPFRGTVSLLSDYLLVTRDEEGALRNVFMRIDDRTDEPVQNGSE